MVGRTPEFLGKKVEAREMKIATIVALLHPLIILGGVALSCFLLTQSVETGIIQPAAFTCHKFRIMSSFMNILRLRPIMVLASKDWATILTSGTILPAGR